MHPIIDRRRFLACASGAAIASPLLALGATEVSPSSTSAPGPTKPYLLGQDPVIVRQVVGASHRDLEMVKSLVDRQPALVNATTDWGFGDWEMAIDAASHTGQTEIAQYLIEKGARPTIFTLAMLGHLDALRASIAAYPGIQRTRGPHGITLLTHARMGGDENAPTIQYLTALGDADPVYPGAQLMPAIAGPYLGVYAFGPDESDRIEVANEKDKINFRRAGGNNLRLFQVEEHVFHPAGAPAVRIAFTLEDGRATSVSLADPDVYLTAMRVEG